MDSGVTSKIGSIEESSEAYGTGMRTPGPKILEEKTFTINNRDEFGR